MESILETSTEPRLVVLNMALNLENELNLLLLSLFKIKKDSTVTLGHKSSAISFKTKVDLLYDLDRIDKKTHGYFIAFMEIRNQFMHNLDALTFEIVLKRIQKDVYILKLVPEMTDIFKKNDVPLDFESLYFLGVHELEGKILKSLEDIYTKVQEELQEDRIKMEDAYSSVLGVLALKETLDEFKLEFSEWAKGKIQEEPNFGGRIVSMILKQYRKKSKKKGTILSSESSKLSRINLVKPI